MNTLENRFLRAGLRVLPLFAALAMAGCASHIDNPPKGYTCCNMRLYYGWISSDNSIFDGTIIPFGSPAELTSVKRSYYVYGTIDDASVGLRDDSAHSEAETLEWVRRVVVPDNPATRVATWPADVQLAVRGGRVFTGMTKEQVLVSLGYPSRKDTRDISGKTWRYDVSTAGAYVDLVFDGEKLVDIQGPAPAVSRVVFAH